MSRSAALWSAQGMPPEGAGGVADGMWFVSFLCARPVGETFDVLLGNRGQLIGPLGGVDGPQGAHLVSGGALVDPARERHGLLEQRRQVVVRERLGEVLELELALLPDLAG